MKTEAIMLCMNERIGVLVFSRSFLAPLFDSWDFIPPSNTQRLSASVWGINLTLCNIRRAIYNLQVWSESLSKQKREGEKKTSSLMAVD